MEPLIVLKEWRHPPYRMTSALANQGAIELWDYALDKEDKELYWLWPSEHREPGAHIHCGSPIRVGRKRSEGYGGQTLKFKTKEGVLELQGPWHSNSEALFERTGTDLREKHLTWGVIALNQRWEKGQYDPVFVDIIYIDPDDGTVGKFERIAELAQKFANILNRVVYSFSQSHGGSSSGPIHPNSWSEEKVEAYWRSQRANTR